MPRVISIAGLLFAVAGGAGLTEASERPADARAAPLGYETSAFELAPFIPLDPPAWTEADVKQEISRRLLREKRRRELVVDYYRIGHALSFPLPLAQRPTKADLPAGIATITYPWLIWLTWELEERWRIAHVAWRRFDDRAAGELLQRELAALATWDHFYETMNQPGLATAHLAACLARALANPDGWDAEKLKSARAAAEALVERDVWPWFLKTWSGDQPYTARRLANIPVITLARAAQLARVIGSTRADAMEAKTGEILRAWMKFRTGAELHTEGTAYDGYLMDTLTEWLAFLPAAQRDELLHAGHDTFRSLADEWIELTLPGRFDLHAPIGDVEPQMTFWTAPLLRIASWYKWTDAAWLMARVPLNRLPAASLVEAQPASALFAGATASPPVEPRQHPHAVSLRSGWASRDIAAVVSVPRTPMSHLHNDAGHITLGWQGRFWITDPGYQQYRKGDERTYTLGPAAHNPPVLNTLSQSHRAGVVLGLDRPQPEVQHVALDLGACYNKLPATARVQRDIWLATGNDMGAVVRDTFAALEAKTDVATHWLGGAHLAWAFVDGWARLSDGEHALWIGTVDEPLAPSALTRDVGTRGPLTLSHRTNLADGSGVRWWVFWCDAAGGWSPPRVTATGSRLHVEPDRRSGANGGRWFGD